MKLYDLTARTTGGEVLFFLANSSGKSVKQSFRDRKVCGQRFITWYLQLSMNEAFTMVERGGHVGEEVYGQILNHLVDSKRFTFEDRYASLTEKQKMVLLAIASEFPNQPTLTSQEFISTYGLKTASRNTEGTVLAVFCQD